MDTEWHENHTFSLGKGLQGRTGHHKSRGSFMRKSFLSPEEPIPGTRTLSKKRQFFTGSSFHVNGFGCVAASEVSVSGLGILTPFHIGRQLDEYSHFVAKLVNATLRNGFLRSLRVAHALQLRTSRFSLGYFLQLV
ncbi:hypothetical protein AVEN_93489-1 [Araneus ventricosus]|uniref:Uncharacterized protein n=1 Tax=Araneus ventricosus TaxID=182803 RepID=A0A4Y2APG8_ARAVE|nr:hypothetical protein AVEN_93489-1 [Araneus ventricosus]